MRIILIEFVTHLVFGTLMTKCLKKGRRNGKYIHQKAFAELTAIAVLQYGHDPKSVPKERRTVGMD